MQALPATFAALGEIGSTRLGASHLLESISYAALRSGSVLPD